MWSVYVGQAYIPLHRIATWHIASHLYYIDLITSHHIT